MTRRTFSIALLLALPVASLGAPVRAVAGDTLRVLTYNIYYGGQDHTPVFGRDEEWLDVIRSVDPDLLFIEEANGWLPSEQNYIAAYVESLNASSPGEPPYAGFVGQAPAFHVAFLSRVPVLAFEAFDKVVVGTDTIDIHHVFAHATLDLGGDTAHAIGVHFKPGNARADREREARALLAILDGLPAEQTVWVAGDFNSYSPDDLVPGSGLEPDYAGGAEDASVKGWEPAGYLRDRGYHDAYREQHPAEPGYTQNTLSFIPDAMGPVQRVDFTLRSPGSPWRIETAERVTEAPADIASDHYAVFSTFVYRPWTAVPEGAPIDAAPVRIHPNPAIGESRVSFEIGRPGPVRVRMYSLSGRLVGAFAEDDAPAGSYELPLFAGREGGASIPPGLYFIRIENGLSVETARFLWLGPRD
jgi:endonuclease/exonuclease/phosphatase family metal-dependent hydrolase